MMKMERFRLLRSFLVLVVVLPTILLSETKFSDIDKCGIYKNSVLNGEDKWVKGSETNGIWNVNCNEYVKRIEALAFTLRKFYDGSIEKCSQEYQNSFGHTYAFNDLEGNPEWEINTANCGKSLGIVNGYNDGTGNLGIHDKVSYEQTFAMALRASNTISNISTLPYHWADAYLSYLYNRNLPYLSLNTILNKKQSLDGETYLGFDTKMTRGEVIYLIDNIQSSTPQTISLTYSRIAGYIGLQDSYGPVGDKSSWNFIKHEKAIYYYNKTTNQSFIVQGTFFNKFEELGFVSRSNLGLPTSNKIVDNSGIYQNFEYGTMVFKEDIGVEVKYNTNDSTNNNNDTNINGTENIFSATLEKMKNTRPKNDIGNAISEIKCKDNYMRVGYKKFCYQEYEKGRLAAIYSKSNDGSIEMIVPYVPLINEYITRNQCTMIDTLGDSSF
ncbi:MAG: hypothetical protein JXQ76_09935, partial [Campylobacterales bacterium]|nr:hypothetical protein [Campylobacterales bacterium]